jgi:predicted dehydrogenase
MSDTIRWGVLGAGKIATKFCDDLGLLPDHRVVAVGARTPGGADEFADRFAIARRHGSYAELAADPDVDAVYVANPHPFHHDAALLAIEAMWTRFLPHMVTIRDVLASGRLGDVVLVTAEHGQRFVPDPAHRAFDPALGGGALLDIGIYPVSFASMVLGTPSRITAVSDPAFTGVDGQTSMLLQHDGGAHAVLSTTLRAATPSGASITGTDARIEIDPVFYRPTSFTIVDHDDARERVEIAVDGNGLRFQAAEVGRCLRAGLTQSPALPLAESVAILETLDEVRRQIGLRYASDPA